MLKVKYVGPRVEISHHGISYKKDKEDKYVYLMVALELLRNIDNDYEKQSAYSHCYESHPLDESEVHSILKEYEANVEEHADAEYHHYEEKIKHELEFVKGLSHLSDIEKEVWMKNIELMKSYRLQRAINKIYYEHCISNIRKLIIQKKIKEIMTPFNKDFFHVINSLKGQLITGKPSLDAHAIEEMNNDDQMCIKLKIG
jgi:acyl-CoA synthetase (NDP forming)